MSFLTQPTSLVMMAIIAVTLTSAALGPVTEAIGIAGQLSPLRASALRVLAILDQPEHACGLAHRTVRRRVVRVLAGLAEAAQIRHDRCERIAEQRDDFAPVVTIAGPAMQQHDRGTGPAAVIRQGEAIDWT